jgi:hypothetical protein
MLSLCKEGDVVRVLFVARYLEDLVAIQQERIEDTMFQSRRGHTDDHEENEIWCNQFSDANFEVLWRQ